MITENQLEQLTIQWFRNSSWNYVHGPDIAPESTQPEREDYSQVILKGRLLRQMARINPHLSPEALEEAAHIAATPAHPSLPRNNRESHRYLLKGIPVEVRTDDTPKTEQVFLIDFANPSKNEFLVVNQFSVVGTKGTRRPDLVLFVNGLPLSVLELKNPADENADIWDAYNQIQTYKDEIGDLFNYNEVLVISDGITARTGSLTANREWFLPWRAVADQDDRPTLEFELETVVRGLFNPELFLDYIRYFVLFETDGDETIKKIAGYHQFHGVREAVRVTLIAAQEAEEPTAAEARATYGQRVQPGSGKAGVFWHTQGSGKSISMCCYAGKLVQQVEMNNPTIVVVTDRNDLDGQLFEQFSKAQDLLRQRPEQAETREALRAMLESRQSGGIIFTTIQKFSLVNGESEHPLLCNRSNVVVISDEAHRSQYGLKAKLNTKTGEYKFGFAKHLRTALPNASFIGFTGTPIAQEDRDTRGLFGDYVSIYDMEDAVGDGAVVPIYYESRLAKLNINRAEIEELNREVDEVIEDEEDVAEREKTKSRWAELAKLVGAQPRLAEVAQDLVAHFETRAATIEGKAMIVAMSREICVSLFKEIIALRPDWEGSKITKEEKEIGYNPEDGAIRVVMTGNATDKKHIQEHIYSRQQKKRLEKRFKDPDDPLKLVIVRDMWLTGFDAPVCHTMYVDKPMYGHNVMQAIARVNRVFGDKRGGLVVDYIGIAGDLKEAMKQYTDSKGKGSPTLETDVALDVLLEKMDTLRGMMHSFDYSDFETDALELLMPATDHIYGLLNGKKRFLDVMASVRKAFSLCSTLDEAAALKKEIAFFEAIRASIIKYTTVDQRQREDERNSVLKRILDNAVISEGVIDVYRLAGIDRPDISILSEGFLEDIRNIPVKNLAVQLLEKLLRDEIRGRNRTNVVQETKYSDRLEATLRKYQNRGIETVQVIEELIAMAKAFREDLKRDEELGLNPDEIAFYDALANNESAVRELGNETLKKLATELTAKLRKSTTVDWQKRESVRAHLRILVRRLLRRYKYPPDEQPEAIELILKQAEALSDIWSAKGMVQAV